MTTTHDKLPSSDFSYLPRFRSRWPATSSSLMKRKLRTIFLRGETRGNVPPPRNCAPSDVSAKSAVPVLSGILLGLEEIIFTMLRVGGPLEHAGPCASYGEIGHRELDRGSVVVIEPTTESRR